MFQETKQVHFKIGSRSVYVYFIYVHIFETFFNCKPFSQCFISFSGGSKPSFVVAQPRDGFFSPSGLLLQFMDIRESHKKKKGMVRTNKKKTCHRR